MFNDFKTTKFMKKTILLTVVLLLGAGTTMAQKQLRDNIAATAQEQQAQKEEVEETRYKVKGGISFNYGFVEHGYMFRPTIMFKGIFVEYGMGSQEFDEAGMKIDTWNLSAGYNYRGWIGRSFYLQAAAGIGYGSSKVKLEGSKDEESSGGALLSLRPAVGLRIWKTLSLEAGYRWDFSDLKFDKAHTSDYFNIGINFGF